MGNNTIIKLEKVNLKFKDKNILSDYSLEIAENEVVCFKAPSGFGKTSILNLLMGFIKPDSGTIVVDGLVLSPATIHEIRKKFAWLPQNYNLFATKTVAQAIESSFEHHCNKRIKPNKDEIVNSLNLLNLESDILEKTFDKISGGERQRIGILISKLMKRRILLLDEPTSALDKDSKEKIIDFLLKDCNSTIVSASHDDDWLSACTIIEDLEKGERHGA